MMTVSASSSNSTTIGVDMTPPLGIRKIVEWHVGKNIKIIGYPQGRGFPADKSGIKEARETVSKRVSDATQAIQAGESGLWAKKLLTHSPSILTFYCVTKEMSEVVTKFPRFPKNDEDFSTPFDSPIWKSLFENFLSISITPLTLSKEGSKIIDQAISEYLSKYTDQSSWAQFTKDHFFEAWSNTPEWRLGYRSFSSVAWAITSKLILGDSSEESNDFSSLWNDLFSPENTLDGRKEILKQDYYGKMVPYLQSLIQRYRENPSKFPNTFQAYLTECNIYEKLIVKLTPDEIDLATQYAAKLEMSLEDYFIFSSIVTISLGMQENFAFTVTETLKQICNNTDILKKCQNSLKMCLEAVKETLRYIPPSGQQRQARWDLTIIDGNVGKRYELDAKDGIATHPLYLGRNPEIFINPELFDLNREGKGKACPFSSGLHHCPGETAALKWMKETIFQLITHYKVSVENPEQVDYETHFTLKSFPEVKILVEKL